jgi:succinyl-CoA synthetase beta subunit/citryl-CoA synthetase large subunit
LARVYEDEAKRLLRNAGITVPQGVAVSTALAARRAARALGKAMVVKALIPTGRRQKAGGIHFCATPADTKKATKQLLGSVLLGYRVRRLLVEERLELVRELYFALTYDSAARGAVALFGTAGGVDVEATDRVIRRAVDIELERQPYVGRALVQEAGLPEETTRAFGDFFVQAVNLFTEVHASLLEINPLGQMADGRLVAVGALLELDDQAASRRTLSLTRRSVPSRSARPPTPLERRIAAIAARHGRPEAVRFNEFDGDIALMVTTAGGSNVCLDHLLRLGARPLSFFDITAGEVEEPLYECIRAVLTHPRLRGLLVGGNLTGFSRVDMKMRALVRALRDEQVDLNRVAVAARLGGPGEEEAAALARTVPGLKHFRDDATLEDAVDWVVLRTRQARP